MKITKELVLQAASDIADRDGLSGVSLKVVAEALNIRTPSLYNHIDSLDELLKEMAHEGMCVMNKEMTQAVIGVSGEAGIHKIAQAYLSYMIAHPGIYEAIQWVCWHADDRTTVLLAEYHSLLTILINSCNLKVSDPSPIVRLLAVFMHGYATQQLGNAITNPDLIAKDMSHALDVVMTGIKECYK